jgi:hypothetical protein
LSPLRLSQQKNQRARAELLSLDAGSTSLRIQNQPERAYEARASYALDNGSITREPKQQS